MAHIKSVRGKLVNLDKVAKELGVPKESLRGKYNRPLLQEWVKNQEEEED